MIGVEVGDHRHIETPHTERHENGPQHATPEVTLTPTTSINEKRTIAIEKEETITLTHVENVHLHALRSLSGKEQQERQQACRYLSPPASDHRDRE